MDGRLQSVTGTAVHGVRHDYGVVSEGGTYRLYDAEIKLNADGSDSSEIMTNFFDMMGRVYKTAYSGSGSSPYSISYFNTRGQRTNDVDPDGVSTLYIFNNKGEQTHRIVDLNQDHVIDFSGSDRITMVTNDVVSDNGANVRRTQTYTWATNNSSSSVLARTDETSTDGLTSWHTIWNNGVALTTTNQTVIDAAHGIRIEKTLYPDGSSTVLTNQNGQLISSTTRDGNGAQTGQTIYGYDAHGRRSTETDARTGTTTNGFDNADQVTSVTTPSPGTGPNAQVTTTTFNNRGWVSNVQLPDGGNVTPAYFSTGEVATNSGARTYPVAFTYDYAGRQASLTTWTNFVGGTGSATTRWTNDTYRGFLINKVYADGTGPSYGYTSAGRLKTRTWARGVATTNGYNAAGEVGSITYSDASTSSVLYGYDRRGRATAITNGATICTLSFNDAGQVLSETYSGGPLDGIAVTNAYDGFLRRNKQVTLLNGTVLATTTNGFDAASRLQVVSDGTNSANYAFLANSPLVSSLTFKQSSTTRLTAAKTYDNLNRLFALTNTPSTDSALRFNYAYNSANQRTGVTNQDSSRWAFLNDFLGQVTSGKKYWSDGTVVAGQQFEYAFDDIGNRTYANSGGDAAGANLRAQSYTVNNLNQYTQRTVPGYVDVLGAATNTADVVVNNLIASRKGEYYRQELTVANNTAAVWQGVTNLGFLVQSTNSEIVSGTTGNIFIAQSPESFGYDTDGNQTNDGRWALTWNAENRLMSITSLSTAPTASKRKLDFTYDYFGRRTQKIASTNNGSGYIGQYTNRFLYDGWNVAAVFDGGTNLLYSFRWGTDASGTPRGAGGVGGLLTMTVHSGALAGVYLYSYDGNHNVVALVSAADGTIAAQYEYGPFGQLLRATGPLAFINPFRFSTKFQDDETGFLYYGYRFYATRGTWLNRDPLGELGGRNLYGFANNSAVDRIDALGGQMFSDPYELTVMHAPRPSGLAAQLIEHYFNGRGELFTNGGEELRENRGVKDGIRLAIYDLVTRECDQAGAGKSFGSKSLQIRDVQASGFWLVQTLNMPYPFLLCDVHYVVSREPNCPCTVHLDFQNTWYDEADMHATRDGKLLFPDFVAAGLQHVGIGKEFPIVIRWLAEGTARVRGKFVDGSGWPFE
jgi:RHS repeat-associated protein